MLKILGYIVGIGFGVTSLMGSYIGIRLIRALTDETPYNIDEIEILDEEEDNE